MPIGTSQSGQCGLPEPGEENPQVVVDFGDRADARTGRVAQVLLLDGNGRRKPFDMVDLRLLHLADELPGVRAEAFDVAPLAFGIDRVHGQRAFAGAARSAADGNLVAWHLDVDALQVMLPGSPHANRLGGAGHGSTSSTLDYLKVERVRLAGRKGSAARPGRCAIP